jgi:hypothetical protein
MYGLQELRSRKAFCVVDVLGWVHEHRHIVHCKNILRSPVLCISVSKLYNIRSGAKMMSCFVAALALTQVCIIPPLPHYAPRVPCTIMRMRGI